MGLFKKKADPLAQRAQTLNRRIAELEAEIARLSVNVAPGTAHRPDAAPSSTSVRTPPAAPLPSHEPVFEKMPVRFVDPRVSAAAGKDAEELGLKRSVWTRAWRRVKAQIADPPPANEKLVNYLAAGGIQGLRPLRFERRIARNRITFICVVLGLLLWGLLVMFRHTR